MNAVPDEFHRLHEEAMRDAFEEGKAIVDEAVEKAEARRRFQVDPQGRAVIAYADPDHKGDREEHER